MSETVPEIEEPLAINQLLRRGPGKRVHDARKGTHKEATYILIYEINRLDSF